MMTPQELESLLFREIPLASQMGVQDFLISEHEVSLLLPLEPNRNHKLSMFGGSLYSASALACYGLFLAGLKEHGYSGNNIVIAEGHIRYFKPVTKNTRVSAKWNSEAEKRRFFQTLITKKKARVIMVARTEEAGQLCTEFSSSFATWL